MSTSTQQDRPNGSRQTQPVSVRAGAVAAPGLALRREGALGPGLQARPARPSHAAPRAPRREGQAPDRRHLDHAGAHHRRAVDRRLNTDHRRDRGALAPAAALSGGCGAAASRARARAVLRRGARTAHPPRLLPRAASPSGAGGAAVHPRSAGRDARPAPRRIPNPACWPCDAGSRSAPRQPPTAARRWSPRSIGSSARSPRAAISSATPSPSPTSPPRRSSTGGAPSRIPLCNGRRRRPADLLARVSRLTRPATRRPVGRGDLPSAPRRLRRADLRGSGEPAR